MPASRMKQIDIGCFLARLRARSMQFTVAASVSLALAGLPACATIINGSDQPLTLKSIPGDAKLTIYDVRNGNTPIASGTTPQIVTLKRGSGYFRGAKYRVVMQKDQYTTEELTITGNINGWYLGGNLIFGGLIGYLILDPLTGGMWTLSSDDVTMNLSTVTAEGPHQPSLVVMLKEALTDFSPETLTKLQPVAQVQR